jgi:hypothetical protein
MDGPLNAHHRQLVSVLGLVRIETFLPNLTKSHYVARFLLCHEGASLR